MLNCCYVILTCRLSNDLWWFNKWFHLKNYSIINVLIIYYHFLLEYMMIIKKTSISSLFFVQNIISQNLLIVLINFDFITLRFFVIIKCKKIWLLNFFIIRRIQVCSIFLFFSRNNSYWIIIFINLNATNKTQK